MNMKKSFQCGMGIGLVAMSLILAGCPAPPPPPAPPPNVTVATPPPFVFKTKTGTPITIQQDPKLISTLVAQRHFGVRPDPFALLAPERSFNQSQTTERVLGEIGGFATMYQPVEEVADQSEFGRGVARSGGVRNG